ncbi:lysozyme C [Scomber scombrus]|uniref:lysozyme C n=1 Tax=Scomber scombrus TaxID=13677 RepID=UPI002DDAE335|nr:lysozyme C [Scomber scombrus]
MKVLVVFLLVVLDSSLTEGRIVSKCELRDEMMRAMSTVSQRAKQKGLTAENLLAKIVCHVEEWAGFNTSAVYQLNPTTENHPRRGKREVHSAGVFGLAKQGSLFRTTQNPPTPTTRPAPPDEEVWTLYGLFQLSNHLVCSDGITPSPNICNIDCNNLVDDNISDDITCVLKILTNLVIRIILQEECRDKQFSVYFAECS